MDFDLTNKDIHDADLSFGDEDNRVYELENIYGTQLFKEIGIYPVNVSEMDYFIDSMDIINVFKDLNAPDTKKFSPKRLDALYIILKYINLSTVNFCEYAIRNFIEKDFNNLFFNYVMPITEPITNDRMASIMAFLEEFYVDTSNFLVRFLKTFSNHTNDCSQETLVKLIPQGETLENLPAINSPKLIPQGETNLCDSQVVNATTKRFTRYISRLLNSDYYDDVLTKFKISFNGEFFLTHFSVFEQIIKKISEYANMTTKPIMDKINTVVSIFIDDTNVSDDELFTFLENNIDINELVVADSDAIESFIVSMMDKMSPEDVERLKPPQIFEYDNFLYVIDRKLDNKIHSFWLDPTLDTSTNFSNAWTNYNYSKKNNAKLKAEKLGFLLYPEKSMHDILMPFVMHNLIKSVPDLIKLIVATMESKNEPGIFNKYDSIDLETAFMLVAMSNEINNTYDAFLLSLKEKLALPNEYPIEFVLRLVSRVLNIIIKFYDENLVCTEFDNTLYQIYNEPINIFQLNFMEYYLLQSKTEPFIPITDIQSIVAPIKNMKRQKKMRILEI